MLSRSYGSTCLQRDKLLFYRSRRLTRQVNTLQCIPWTVHPTADGFLQNTHLIGRETHLAVKLCGMTFPRSFSGTRMKASNMTSATDIGTSVGHQKNRYWLIVSKQPAIWNEIDERHSASQRAFKPFKQLRPER